jgi:hypothetical protein
MYCSDFRKSPQQILLDLINNEEGSELTLSMVTFGVPTALIGQVNTQIMVSAAQGSQFSGSVVVTYNRVNLGSIPGNRSKLFSVGQATHISDLIPAINAAYQINLTSADYIDAPLPSFGQGQSTLNFQISAALGSLVYRGNVVLQITTGLIPLSSVITVTALNGLIYIQPNCQHPPHEPWPCHPQSPCYPEPPDCN